MKNRLDEFKDYVEQDIQKYKCDEKIKKELRYVLLDGKNIRAMMLLVGEKNYKKFFPVALAIEMIHNYSLIHDDLPCMDDDDMRRGKPTLHKRLGEGVALLIGDALLTHAFEKIIDSDFSEIDKLKILKLLINACGINEGMILGQYYDINNLSNYNEIELLNINNQKTGKMIALPLEIFAYTNSYDIEKYKKVGLLIGELYQIQDDYFDKYKTSEIIGKEINKDIKNGKKTFVEFYSKKEVELKIIELETKINLLIIEFNKEHILYIQKIMKRKY